MPKLTSVEDWTRIHDEARTALLGRQRATPTIYIGMGTCGIAAGAGEIGRASGRERVESSVDAV